MKFEIKPVISSAVKNIDSLNKKVLSKAEHLGDSVNSGTKSTTGGDSKKKIIPALMAAGTSLLMLTGCSQPAKNAPVSAYEQYRQQSSSSNKVYDEDELSLTEFDDENESVPEADKSSYYTNSNNLNLDNNSLSSDLTEHPPYPKFSNSNPENNCLDDSALQHPPYPHSNNLKPDDSKKSSTEEKIYMYNQRLHMTDERIGDVNGKINDVQNELELKRNELEKIEEKLNSYDRKNPDDKPPGYEADFNKQVKLLDEIRILESSLSELNATKAQLEESMDKDLGVVSDLGGHPYLEKK